MYKRQAVHSQNSLRNNDLFLWRDESATLAHVLPQMRQFTNLMFSGILGRLPDLRIAFLEAGSGWAPYIISKMEPRMKNSLLTQPSTLIERGQIYFQCGEEQTTSRDLELLGDHCLLWASDFPHEGIIDMTAAVKEFLIREGTKDSTFYKIKKGGHERVSDKDINDIIEWSRNAKKLILPLTRRIDDKRVIEQVAIMRLLNENNISNGSSKTILMVPIAGVAIRKTRLWKIRGYLGDSLYYGGAD